MSEAVFRILQGLQSRKRNGTAVEILFNLKLKFHVFLFLSECHKAAYEARMWRIDHKRIL